jgi:ribosomal protein L11 methyltransferase
MSATNSSSETYICIRCVIPPELEEELPELLAPWPVLGTEIGEASSDGVRVTVYVDGTAGDAADGIQGLLMSHGAEDVELGSLEADDWMAGFREQIRPFAVGGHWWIDPRPDQPTAAPAGRRRLVVEPRTAFGSGTHESTRGILVELEDLRVEGQRVLDVGTGSGILAVAAESLGAKWVIGLDIDPSAVSVAFDVVRQQEWWSHVSLVLGSLDCLGGAEFDIVMCNMIASKFLPLAGDLRSSLAPAGVAVFSGLLESEAEPVCTALNEVGFSIAKRRDDGDWTSLTAVAAPMP